MVDCWAFVLVVVVVGEDLVGGPIAAIKDQSKIWDLIKVVESLNLYHIESIVINKCKCDVLFLLLEKISEGWRRSTAGLPFCVVVVLVKENELDLPGAAATNDINNGSISNSNTK